CRQTGSLTDRYTDGITRFAVGLQDDLKLAAAGKAGREANIHLIHSRELSLRTRKQHLGGLPADSGRDSRGEPYTSAVENEHGAWSAHVDRARDEPPRRLVIL